jgi:hypothetical protein
LRLPKLLLLGSVPELGTRYVGVRFDSKANGTGTAPAVRLKGHAAKLPGGLLLSSPCLVQGPLTTPACRSSTCRIYPVPQGDRGAQVSRWKGNYLRIPRRWRAGYFKCAAALAMISPALCAKPLSSTGATAAFDFHGRFARSYCSSEAFPFLLFAHGRFGHCFA